MMQSSNSYALHLAELGEFINAPWIKQHVKLLSSAVKVFTSSLLLSKEWKSFPLPTRSTSFHTPFKHYSNNSLLHVAVCLWNTKNLFLRLSLCDWLRGEGSDFSSSTTTHFCGLSKLVAVIPISWLNSRHLTRKSMRNSAKKLWRHTATLFSRKGWSWSTFPCCSQKGFYNLADFFCALLISRWPSCEGFCFNLSSQRRKEHLLHDIKHKVFVWVCGKKF